MHLRDFLRLNVTVDLVDDLGEIGRSVQLAVRQGPLIAVDNLLDPVDTWVENVAVHRETVRRTISVRWDGTAETVEVDLLV